MNVLPENAIFVICAKIIAKSVEIIYRYRFLLTDETKLYLYYTLIDPYISYCNVAWLLCTYTTNLTRIFLLQKRAVREMTNSDYIYSSTFSSFIYSPQ